MAELLYNCKGTLIRHCDVSGLTFRFEFSKTGPSHDPRFTCYVFVNGEIRGEGQDTTKKSAENIACRIALLSLQNQDQGNHEVAQPVVNPASSDGPAVLHIRAAASPSPVPSPVNGATSNIVVDVNYIGLFNEFCQRNKCLDYSFVEERRGPPHMPEFFCRVIIGQKKYPDASGKSKKEAKKNAAHLALKDLKQENPGDLQLQQLPGLDDVEEAEEDSSKSGSSEDHSSPSAELAAREASQADSSDSQIVFRSSASGTPSVPSTSNSSEGSFSSSAQQMESEPSLAESSDSQITFRSSVSGTPSLPSRPQRRFELAANFSNRKPVHDVTTEDKIFRQDFDNITRLDSGGYGTVYKARKKLDQKYYVVKKVKRRSEKDENEIQTLARLEHKNIVRYYHAWAGEDIFTDNSSSGRHKVESLFIQMEWCADGTLENWIKKMETVDKGKSLHVFRQIIDGVEYIHSNNLIHRDLKPANILFAEAMTVKIADFGLVTPTSRKDKKESLLRTAGQGTESYMAPEQENAVYENEVDIFPLGLILIELFWKFDNKYKYEEWEKLRNAELPNKFVQQFPLQETIIKLMLSKKPKKRPTASYLREYFAETSSYCSKTR